jgi:hypothetical protein
MMLDGAPLCQEIFLLRNRNRYIPGYAARFLELLRGCFRDIGQDMH